MAVELAPVRVNVVAPGIVRTPIWDRLPEEQREAYFEARGAALPVGKVGEPADVCRGLSPLYAELHKSHRSTKFLIGIPIAITAAP
jgi:NAD(P)-dependent dehydrogenase (short-subunit alcohol dehydrogenase family)